MSDGSIGGGIAEGITGIVGGTVKTAVKEIKEAGKTAVSQTTNTRQNSSSSNVSDAYKAADQQKIAQIKKSLHKESIKMSPQPTHSSQPKPQGPIAEQSFGSHQLESLQPVGNQKSKGPSIALKQAINPGERGKQNKG